MVQEGGAATRKKASHHVNDGRGRLTTIEGLQGWSEGGRKGGYSVLQETFNSFRKKEEKF